MKTRRVIALLIAILTLVTATASAEWFYAGLDTRKVNEGVAYEGIYRVYNEKVDGNYTGKIKYVEFTKEEYDKLVDWKFESFEFDYPHAGYDRLYVDGDAQGNTRYNNLFPQWETKFADYVWEIAGEHRIYQRQMTKIPGYGWVWDFGKTPEDEMKVYTATTRNADVKEYFKITGFANLKLNGEKLEVITEYKQHFDPEMRAQYEAINLYKDFGRYYEIEDVFPGYNWENYTVESGFFTPDNLSAIEYKTGEFVVTDLEIEKELAEYTVATKWLEGPTYHGESAVKDVASLYIADKRDNKPNMDWMWTEGVIDWEWDANTVSDAYPVYDWVWNEAKNEKVWDIVDYANIEVSWTAPDYQFDANYNYYQCLVVNGIVFDGTKDTPRIFRYTGGRATPEVEWKYISWRDLRATYAILGELDQFVNNGDLGLTEVVEWKYVDGKPAFENGLPVLRVPTGEFAKCFIKITDSHVELWRETAHGQELAWQFAMNANGPTGSYAGNVPGAVKVEG